MDIVTMRYSFRYTTAGGAHRYKPCRKTKINLGDVYLRGVKEPPHFIEVAINLNLS